MQHAAHAIILLGLLLSACDTATDADVGPSEFRADTTDTTTGVEELPSEALGCCPAKGGIEGCELRPDPADLESCAGDDYAAWCWWTFEGVAFECTQVALYCCDEIGGVHWIDNCWGHGPGSLCDGWGTVLGQRLK